MLSVAMVALCVAASVGGSYVLGLNALHRSNQNWCAALVLLTGNPVPRPADPAANPSREQAYELYQDFIAIERRFGC